MARASWGKLRCRTPYPYRMAPRIPVTWVRGFSAGREEMFMRAVGWMKESAVSPRVCAGMVLAVAIDMAHVFFSHLDWSGAIKGGTRDVATLDRDLDVTIDGTTMAMSSAPAFGGNPLRVNPEQLYVASLSACHALTFLFLAARDHLLVTGYSDDAVGELAMVDGRLRMAVVKLRPQITLDPEADVAKAHLLVEKAHRQCFISNSVSATVEVQPDITFASEPLPAP
jgi:organic hydroperoxide reductase OsmC/OhrA